MKKLILILLVSSVVNSCKREEFFNRERIPEFPWQTVTDFEMSATGAYNIAFHNGWGGGVLIYNRLMRDAHTDCGFYIGKVQDYPMREMYTRLFDQTDAISRVTDVYSWCYDGINDINVALDWAVLEMKENPFPDASTSDKELNVKRIIGELYFMRAWFYYQLAIQFCPAPGNPEFATNKALPWRVTIPKTSQEYMDSEYGTTQEIMNLVISDLKKAIERLPEQYQAGMHPAYQAGRANRYAAHFLLAKTYFRMYASSDIYADSCLQQLDMVINSGKYNLTESPLAAFSHDDNGKGKEVIFDAIYYDQLKGAVPREACLFSKNHIYGAIDGGRGKNWNIGLWRLLSMSKWATEYIGWSEPVTKLPTVEAKKDLRFLQLYYNLYPLSISPNDTMTESVYLDLTEIYLWGDKYFRGKDGRFTNVPVYRLAEAYLTRSILRLKKGDIAGATSDVNMIRNRAGLEPVSIATEEIIDQERIKEMWTEGDRLEYIQALKMPIAPGNRVGTASIPFPYDSYKFYWKLPKDESDLNPIN